MKTFCTIASVTVLLAILPLSFSRVLESLGQSSVSTLDVTLIPFELILAIIVCALSLRSSVKVSLFSVALLVFIVIDLTLPMVPIGPLLGFGTHYYKVVANPEFSYLLSKSHVLLFCAFLLAFVIFVSKIKSKA